LAYFLQKSGIQLKLKFEAHNFGSYADNLNHVLEHFDGYYIAGVGGRVPKAEIKLLPGAVEEADLFLKDHPEAIEKLKKVSSLIAGYETPLSMEVLATVHWVITRSTNGQLSISDVKEKVFNWNAHKQLIKENYILKACKRLIDEGGIDRAKLSIVS
jgi:hypothetical protein